MKRHIAGVLVFLSVLTVHLLLIGEIDAGDSEAYYYSWSKNLSLSYYDHPAGIAVLIRIATLIFADNIFAIRFFSALLINIALLLIYYISLGVYQDDRQALYSMLSLLAMPAFLIGGISAAPEPPLVFFSVISTLFFYKYYTKGRRRDLLISFLSLGIAFNIKYSAIFILISYLIILYQDKRLALPEIRRSLIIFSIFLLPVIIWNLLHRGVSFEYHLLQRVNPLYIPLNLLKFAGGQLLYFNPIIMMLIFFITIRKIREKESDLFFRMFLYTMGISIIPMVLLRDSEPHWSAPAYIFAAIYFSQEITRVRKLLFYAVGLNIILFGILLFHIINPLFTETLLARQNPKYDISNELFGWEIVGENIEHIITSESIDQKEVLLASNHYTMASQMMLATKGRYRVVCRGRRCNQFTIDDVKDESRYRLIIFVTDNRFTDIPPYYRDAAIEYKLTIKRGRKAVREFHIFTKKRP